jgi:hypothetical protein
MNTEQDWQRSVRLISSDVTVDDVGARVTRGVDGEEVHGHVIVDALC